MDRCTTCQYYDRQNKGPGVGQCRREAPSLSPLNAKAYMIEGVWPTVRDDDWCGEWKAGRKTDSRVTEFLSMTAPAASTPQRIGTLAGAASPLTIGAPARGND